MWSQSDNEIKWMINRKKSEFVPSLKTNPATMNLAVVLCIHPGRILSLGRKVLCCGGAGGMPSRKNLESLRFSNTYAFLFQFHIGHQYL